MKRYILVHYGEIGLKRSHEGYFVRKLKDFLRDKLQKRFKSPFRIAESVGRLLVSLPEVFIENEYRSVLAEVFGIQNFAFVWAGDLNVDKLGEQIFSLLPDLSDIETFCVRVKRSQSHELTSAEAERELGAVLLRKGIEKKVKLKNPDLEVNVEFFNNKGFFSFKKCSGPGGLPIGTGGKLLSLISSGFDSPVAAYRMMRRGARMSFVHFHSYPYTDLEEQQQVRQLVEILSTFQFDTRLFLLPFGKVQKAIAANSKVPARYRVLVYRRLMLKIANRLAYKEKAKGLVTGDNLGQVASQTLDNLFACNEASEIPVYRPLISFDKEHIISEAQNIGTADVSAKSCKDTCVMFTPRKPEVKASLYDLQEFEAFLPLDEYVEEVLGASVLIEL